MGYDNGQSKAVKNTIIIIIIAIVVFALVQHGGRRRGVAGIGDPVQKPAHGGTEMEIDGYKLNISYLYSYDISALVVSTHDYAGTDLGGKLAPRDFALAWGTVAQYNDKIDFHWRQSGRWYNWQAKSYEEIEPVGGVEGVSKQSANNHIIPADDTVRKSIKKIKKGDYIKLTGYLVNIDGAKDDGSTFWWNSSTTRNDTGDGSCEVIYVTAVTWLD